MIWVQVDVIMVVKPLSFGTAYTAHVVAKD